MPFFKRSLAGPGYIILNIIRAANIVALLAVVVASCVMLVKTFVVSKFFFFDAISHIITATLGLILIVSELSLFRSYFSRNWPLLSESSGFVTLGLLMIIVGVSILGNLNKEATSQQSLGLSGWQIVISSGIVIFILGVGNVVASYVFRTRSLGITARMVRAHGAVAAQKVAGIVHSSPSHSPRRSFNLGRSDTLPSYRQPSPQPPVAQVHRAPSSVYPASRQSMGRSGLNISAPVRVDQEQFAKFKGSGDVQRPDLAFHPALHGGRF